MVSYHFPCKLKNITVISLQPLKIAAVNQKIPFPSGTFKNKTKNSEKITERNAHKDTKPVVNKGLRNLNPFMPNFSASSSASSLAFAACRGFFVEPGFFSSLGFFLPAMFLFYTFTFLCFFMLTVLVIFCVEEI